MVVGVSGSFWGWSMTERRREVDLTVDGSLLLKFRFGADWDTYGVCRGVVKSFFRYCLADFDYVSKLYNQLWNHWYRLLSCAPLRVLPH